jgi:hypothetical protein
MAGPLFRLQIVDGEGRVVVSPFVAGRLEIDLVEACVTEVLARGVGLGRTSAHVAEDVRSGITAAIQALKDHTKPLVQ